MWAGIREKHGKISRVFGLPLLPGPGTSMVYRYLPQSQLFSFTTSLPVLIFHINKTRQNQNRHKQIKTDTNKPKPTQTNAREHGEFAVCFIFSPLDWQD